LHRELVLSNAYRQASQVEPAAVARAHEVDPENRLLWKMNRRRLEVEALRDTLLAVSGKLDLQMYGRPEAGAAAPDSSRRTIYGLVDRQGLPVMFRNFDFASPDQSIERRPQTVVPQQALFALNSPFMLARSTNLAEQVLAQTGTDLGLIDWLYQRVLQRAPDAEERAVCSEFVSGASPEDKLARWSQLAQVLLASNELLYVD
jgi:hypothetical protein